MVKLEIVEIEYSVSPGGVNSFEVYDGDEDSGMFGFPLFDSEDLMECVKFCYNLGQDFTVRTLAAIPFSFHFEEDSTNV